MKDGNDGTLKKTISGPIFTAQFLEKHGFGTRVFWYSIPCQPKWVFSRHDDSNPLREESYASTYLISCSMGRGQGKQQRRRDEVLHEVDEGVSA